MDKKRYYEVIKLKYANGTDKKCSDEKEMIIAILPEQLGSWSRAITTSDGACHNRLYFSKNGTFIAKTMFLVDFWYGPKSMRAEMNDAGIRYQQHHLNYVPQ